MSEPESLSRKHRRLIEEHGQWFERGNRPASLAEHYAANADAPIMRFIESCTLRRRGYKAGLGMDRAKKRKGL